jgi:hypothetical protein
MGVHGSANYQSVLTMIPCIRTYDFVANAPLGQTLGLNLLLHGATRHLDSVHTCQPASVGHMANKNAKLSVLSGQSLEL